MKRKLIATAAAAAMFMAPAWAHGPGMAGGGVNGPGMMGGYGVQGMGPSMMGPGMMSQGMMGQGMMGQGMMGQGMMGPGVMGGPMMDSNSQLKLSEEQRAKISTIQREASREQWNLMGKMHEQHFNMHDVLGASKLDAAAARKAYDDMSAVHTEMFQSMLEARKRIDAVLTDEQRQQLKRGG